MPPAARVSAAVLLLVLLGVAPTYADGLVFLGFQRDGLGGVDGLDGARAVAVSPDGAHVYVASIHDHAVAVFARDPMTGALGFVETQKNGVGGVDGLDGAFSVAVSPDGAHVYVAGADDEAVAVFVRDPATGALAFVEAPRNGVGGVEGLANALSVTVSPDGARVYVAGNADRAVAVFARDPVTGTLAFVEAQRDGVGGVDGLEGASGVTVSPDGAHVYVASVEEDAVAVFRQITCGDGHLDAGEACEDGNRRAGDCCSPVCQRDAPGTACTDDGNACTADVCDAGGACGVPTPGLPCSDDGNGCTADVCDTVGACGHVAAPAVDCFGATARGGRFVLADRRGAGDRLAWRWRGTTPGRAAAFGDPRGSTAYALCVYSNDPTGGVELALGASVPPGGRCGRRACWQRARGGFAYRDRKGRHAGLRALRLRTGRITVAGRGAQLGLSALPFGADGEVRVQLRRTDGGACWETRFSRAQRGSKLVFRARTD
jgi:cysteine-rich repeat protein